jgi:membrane protein required for colicin V production
MTGFDIAVLAVIALSTLFAFARGVVRELLAIATWIAAVFAAFALGNEVAAALPFLEANPLARQVVGYVLVFVGVLVLGTLMAFLLSKLLRAVSLGFVDRFLGAAFGLARGVIAVVLFVLIAGLTTLPQQEWWQNATLAPPLVAAALSLKEWLPPAWSERLNYGGSAKSVRPGGQSASRADGELVPCVESLA